MPPARRDMCATPKTARLSHCLAFALGAVVFGFAAPAWSDEFIELSIPLEDGRYFSPRDFCAECNRKLRTHYPLDRIPDRKVELTRLERLSLVLAAETGLLRVTFGDDKLVIGVPNREDDRVRRRRRQRLEKLFHLPLTEWPKERGLHLPAEFDPDRRTILLVHGLEADATDLQPFAKACRQAGIQAIIFDYPNDGPIAWSGDRLRSDLEDLCQRHPSLRLAIVAHSMGGLVARHALEAADRPLAGVTHLFMLGTPNHGSKLAGCQELVELVKALPSGKLFSRENLIDGLGEAAVDLRPGSEFLKSLNARLRPADVRYCSATGRRSFLRDKDLDAIRRELDAFFRRRKTADELRKLVLDFLDSDELRDGRGDGAVAVASAHLTPIDGERLFDLDHTELLELPGENPERAEPFVWIVEMLGWGEDRG